jgi:peptidoglycan-N-acetylglucosamine deacetylase
LDERTWCEYFRIMSVSRGKFLKSLGKSLPGMVLGSGMAQAAQTILSKVAAVTDVKSLPPASPKNEKSEIAKIDFIRNGSRASKRIALTFDDGPTPGITELVLDVLKQRQLCATFFMIGNRISAAPEIARRALAEGHEIGNHSLTHRKLTLLPEAEAKEEMQKTQEVIAEVLHHRAVWFRPPFGVLHQKQAAMAQAMGLRVLLWDVDSTDWAKPGEEKIIETVSEKTISGSIIMLHDVDQQTVNALPSILDNLCNSGFIFSRISDLLAEQVEEK